MGCDVFDPPDDGFDWTDGRRSGFVMDDSASLAILLVVKGESGSSALLEEGLKGEGVGQDGVVGPEPDVLESELSCAAALLWV